MGWVGLEPTTNALKGRCSTIELPTRIGERGELIKVTVGTVQVSKLHITEFQPRVPFTEWFSNGDGRPGARSFAEGDTPEPRGDIGPRLPMGVADPLAHAKFTSTPDRGETAPFTSAGVA